MRLAGSSISFLMGFFIYSLLEIVFRGYTHWTMALTGGTVLLVLYNVNSTNKTSLLKNCFIGSVLITTLEFFIGIVVNIIFNWEVWNYEELPFNILGQICLPFTAGWFVISIPAFYICKLIRNNLTQESLI